MKWRTPFASRPLFWVGVLYFAEGFPFGVFYEIFPVHFRQQGIELGRIGVLSLLGLAWTLKFLWAPAIDHFRHHRRWMAAADLAMGAVMVYFAFAAGLSPVAWMAIAAFAVLSATNDIAVDGYTIELLQKRDLGIANGLRIGLYRVGMLTSGGVLIASDWIGWPGAYLLAAVIFAAIAAACLAAPRERAVERVDTPVAAELAALARSPFALGALAAFALGVVWLVDRVTRWSAAVPGFWIAAALGVAALAALVRAAGGRVPAPSADAGDDALARGPLFGALMELLRRPAIVPVLLFILIFKLPDAAMGFMVKPFWVDVGFTAAEIGLVSVNIGLGLSIAGGIVGGYITDRIGIFRALWILGLAQAVSNLGYWIAAGLLPLASLGAGAAIPLEHKLVLYSASAAESFTGGLGTAAFLAFLMAIVRNDRAATEYALLTSVFALSRSVAGWVGGLGAQAMGYGPWFLLTFFLAFPAYLLLPWVRRMLAASR